MTQDRFGVWSPHRDSNSVRSFKAALSLRPEPWQWHEDKERASWWVVDGTLITLSGLGDALSQQRKRGPVETLVLAPTWNYIEDPVWTFFKTPLSIKLLYAWIDHCLQRDFPALNTVASKPSTILRGRKIKLRRWPNLPHYTAHSNQADAVSMTLACAKLLENWVSYEEISAFSGNTALFEQILADAEHHGILEISAPEAPPPPPPSPPPPAKTDAWSLVKRLLQKFST